MEGNSPVTLTVRVRGSLGGLGCPSSVWVLLPPPPTVMGPCASPSSPLRGSLCTCFPAGVSGRVTEDLCWSRRGQRPGRPLPPSVLGQPPTSITCASPPPGQVPGALLPQSPALTPSSLTGLPPPLSFLHQLCSGPRPLLFSLGLSLLLLVGICVIGSQSEGRSMGREERTHGAPGRVGRREGQWSVGWLPARSLISWIT